jgi:hypothetical protein
MAFSEEFKGDETLPKPVVKAAKNTKVGPTKAPDINVKVLKSYMPQAPNCFPFIEQKAGRVRAFYLSPSGYRLSAGASFKKFGEAGACHFVLAWSWNRHYEITSEECPYDWLQL